MVGAVGGRASTDLCGPASSATRAAVGRKRPDTTILLRAARRERGASAKLRADSAARKTLLASAGQPRYSAAHADLSLRCFAPAGLDAQPTAARSSVAGPPAPRA